MAKELSKVPQIRKYIELDPENPGVVSVQRYVNKEGKKSKPYYLWQSSILGEKISIRVPKEEVGQVKQIIASAKAKTRSADKKTISMLKTYRNALDNLIKRNRKVRDRNEKAAAKSAAEKKAKDAKKELKTLNKVIKKAEKK